MLTITKIPVSTHEIVVEATDPSRGLHCFIAVHSTVLGPSLGGIRIYPYTSREEALQDALKLSKAMTYKAAVAELGLGGGKGVIIADPATDKTEDLLQAFAEVVDSLQGAYIAAEDVGSNINDLAIVHQYTPYVAALMNQTSSGDPSHYTAWGVFCGMQATAQYLWGARSLEGKTILVQGLGSVGLKLSYFLFWEGASLIVCDKNETVTEYAKQTFGAQVVSCEDFFTVPCAILSPCALGGVINSTTIPLLNCQAIVGAANNQLHSNDNSEELLDRNILYAPDYIINVGGLINAAAEFNPEGYNAEKARDKTNKLFNILLSLYNRSAQERKSTNEVANDIVLNHLKLKTSKRTQPIAFKQYSII